MTFIITNETQKNQQTLEYFTKQPNWSEEFRVSETEVN